MDDYTYDLIYIEPSIPVIKYIREQFQTQISVESDSNFTFGWIYVKSLSYQYNILSFILCHYVSIIPDQLSIELHVNQVNYYWRW